MQPALPRRVPFWPARLDFPLVILAAIAINLPSLSPAILPAHDGLYAFQVFHFFYTTLFSHGEFPLWVPYGFVGVQADYYVNNFLGPAQVGLGLIGLLFRVENVLLLFKLSMVVLNLFYVAGLWLLAGELFTRRTTRLIATLSLGLSAFWLIQVFFNLTFLAMVPLTLSLLFRFFRTGRGPFFYLAVLTAAVGMWGNIEYFGVIYFYLYILVFAGLAWGRWGTLKALVRPSWANGAAALAAVLASAAYLYAIYHQFDGIHFYPVGGRDPVTFRSTLEDFLTYNGTPRIFAIAAEFLLGKSLMSDLVLYCGAVPVFFFLATLFLPTRRASRTLLVAFLFFAAIALGGLFAMAAFHFPLFSYYRHLGYLWAIERILLVLLAGFSIDALFDHAKADSAAPGAGVRAFLGRLPVWPILLLLVLILSQKDLMSPSYFQFATDADLVLGTLAWRFALLAAIVIALVILAKKARWVLPQALALLLLLFVLGDLGLFRWARVAIFPRLSHPIAFQPLNRPAPWTYRPMRSENPLEPKDNLAAEFFFASGGVRYAFHHSFDRTEAGYPRGRVDFISKPLARLLEARGVTNLQEYDQITRDPILAKSLAIEYPKWAASGTPRIVRREPEAFGLLRGKDDFVSLPVILATDLAASEASRPGAYRGPQILSVNAFTPNRIRLQLAVDSPGWLVYSDAWHPDWKARVDGAPRAVRAANLAFKAVHLQPGDRELVLSFKHFGPAHAGWLASTTIGFLLGLGLLASLLAGRPRGTDDAGPVG